MERRKFTTAGTLWVITNPEREAREPSGRSVCGAVAGAARDRSPSRAPVHLGPRLPGTSARTGNHQDGFFRKFRSPACPSPPSGLRATCLPLLEPPPLTAPGRCSDPGPNALARRQSAWAAVTKTPDGWPSTRQAHFLTALEARNLRSSCWQVLVSPEASPLGVRTATVLLGP